MVARAIELQLVIVETHYEALGDVCLGPLVDQILSQLLFCFPLAPNLMHLRQHDLALLGHLLDLTLSLLKFMKSDCLSSLQRIALIHRAKWRQVILVRRVIDLIVIHFL